MQLKLTNGCFTTPISMKNDFSNMIERDVTSVSSCNNLYLVAWCISVQVFGVHVSSIVLKTGRRFIYCAPLATTNITSFFFTNTVLYKFTGNTVFGGSRITLEKDLVPITSLNIKSVEKTLLAFIDRSILTRRIPDSTHIILPLLPSISSTCLLDVVLLSLSGMNLRTVSPLLLEGNADVFNL